MLKVGRFWLNCARRADLRERAAFRRGRVDVVEMLEVGGIFQVAEGGDAVTLGLLLVLRAGGPERRSQRRAGGDDQHVRREGDCIRKRSIKCVRLFSPPFPRPTTIAREGRRRHISATARRG